MKLFTWRYSLVCVRNGGVLGASFAERSHSDALALVVAITGFRRAPVRDLRADVPCSFGLSDDFSLNGLRRLTFEHFHSVLEGQRSSCRHFWLNWTACLFCLLQVVVLEVVDWGDRFWDRFSLHFWRLLGFRLVARETIVHRADVLALLKWD